MGIEGPIGRIEGAISEQVSKATARPQNYAEAYASFGPTGRVAKETLNRSQGAPSPQKPPTYKELDALGKQLGKIDAKLEKMTSGLDGFVRSFRLAWASLIGDKVTLDKLEGELNNLQIEKSLLAEAFTIRHAISKEHLTTHIQEAQNVKRLSELESKIGDVQKLCNGIGKQIQGGRRAYFAKPEVQEDHKLLTNWAKDAGDFLKKYQENPKQFTQEQVERELSSIERLITTCRNSQLPALVRECDIQDRLKQQGQNIRRGQL